MATNKFSIENNKHTNIYYNYFIVLRLKVE